MHPPAKQRRPVADRFWPKVAKAGDADCWLWTAYIDRKGYGVFDWPGGTRAHRAAWAFTNGPIPDGLFVCHSCDTRACVNPAHLFVGTNADNMRDAKAKGRLGIGLRGRGKKLTAADVGAVRALLARGWSRQRVAIRYGVSKTSINAIAWGRNWRFTAAACACPASA